jgi:hypothetical protein
MFLQPMCTSPSEYDFTQKLRWQPFNRNVNPFNLVVVLEFWSQSSGYQSNVMTATNCFQGYFIIHPTLAITFNDTGSNNANLHK